MSTKSYQDQTKVWEEDKEKIQSIKKECERYRTNCSSHLLNLNFPISLGRLSYRYSNRDSAFRSCTGSSFIELVTSLGRDMIKGWPHLTESITESIEEIKKHIEQNSNEGKIYYKDVISEMRMLDNLFRKVGLSSDLGNSLKTRIDEAKKSSLWGKF